MTASHSFHFERVEWSVTRAIQIQQRVRLENLDKLLLCYAAKKLSSFINLGWNFNNSEQHNFLKMRNSLWCTHSHTKTSLLPKDNSECLGRGFTQVHKCSSCLTKLTGILTRRPYTEKQGNCSRALVVKLIVRPILSIYNVFLMCFSWNNNFLMQLIPQAKQEWFYL